MNKFQSALLSLGAVALVTACTNLTLYSEALAEISFVSGTGSVTLKETIDDNGSPVFVFDDTAEDETTVLTFATDSACPGVAMTGGAEFVDVWSCVDGVITATVTDRGGMSFGPGPEEITTFYVSFSEVPAPPGSDVAPEALSGIQISVFGDINRWDLDGELTSDGAVFGVELGGPEGGEAHFRMDLPAPAVEFFGGVLGVFIGGKADPFATVTTNEDGSASVDVDIATLVSGAGVLGVRAMPKTVTKKITAGQRTLSVGFNRASAKTGKSVGIKVCSGVVFTEGDKVAAKFTLGGSAVSLKKSVTLDSSGCGQSTLKLKGVKTGRLTAKVTYKGDRAKTTLKVTK